MGGNMHEGPYEPAGPSPAPHRCSFCSEESPWCNGWEAAQPWGVQTATAIAERARELLGPKQAEALAFALASQIGKQAAQQ